MNKRDFRDHPGYCGPDKEHDLPGRVRQSWTVETRGVDREKRTVDFIVSTEDRDRYNTKVVGWKLKEYRKNPVITWAHMYGILPIGRALKIGLDPLKRLVARDEFAPEDINPFAAQVFGMVAENWLRTASAGFLPGESSFVDEKPEDGKTKKRGFWLLKNNVLIEHAIVPVPANPNATKLAVQRGILDPQYEQMFIVNRLLGMTQGDQSKAQEWVRQRDLEWIDEWRYDGNESCELCGTTDPESHAFACPESATDASRQLTAVHDDDDHDTECRTVVPFKKYPLAKADTPWNGPKERAAASIDDLKKMATWFVAGSEKKSDFKLIHHRQKDLWTVLRGVNAAVAALLGARGGVKIPSTDRFRVFNHLAKHLKEFGKMPPKFKSADGVEMTAERFFAEAYGENACIELDATDGQFITDSPESVHSCLVKYTVQLDDSVSQYMTVETDETTEASGIQELLDYLTRVSDILNPPSGDIGCLRAPLHETAATLKDRLDRYKHMLGRIQTILSPELRGVKGLMSEDMLIEAAQKTRAWADKTALYLKTLGDIAARAAVPFDPEQPEHIVDKVVGVTKQGDQHDNGAVEQAAKDILSKLVQIDTGRKLVSASTDRANQLDDGLAALKDRVNRLVQISTETD